MIEKKKGQLCEDNNAIMHRFQFPSLSRFGLYDECSGAICNSFIL
jgi:hypothetical protein